MGPFPPLRWSPTCTHVELLNSLNVCKQTSDVSSSVCDGKTGAKLLQNLFFCGWCSVVDLCFDYVLPGGEISRGFDQHLLSDASGCVLFTLQSRAAGVRDSYTAPTASCPTTRAPRSRAPTGVSAYPSLKVTYATARWTTPTHGKHKQA